MRRRATAPRASAAGASALGTLTHPVRRANLPRMWLRALAVWLAIIAAESVHGTLRELFLAPAVGDLRARQLSVATGALLILAIATACARWLRAETPRAQLAVGALWVALTVGFELALGRLVLHHDWARLTQDYDPRRGGFLALGMAMLALAPRIAAKLRAAR